MRPIPDTSHWVRLAAYSFQKPKFLRKKTDFESTVLPTASASSDGAAIEAMRMPSVELGRDDKPHDAGDSSTSICQLGSHSSHLPLSKTRTIALVVTLTGAAFIKTLAVQASVVILPTIGRDLDIPPPG